MHIESSCVNEFVELTHAQALESVVMAVLSIFEHSHTFEGINVSLSAGEVATNGVNMGWRDNNLVNPVRMILHDTNSHSLVDAVLIYFLASSSRENVLATVGDFNRNEWFDFLFWVVENYVL